MQEQALEGQTSDQEIVEKLRRDNPDIAAAVVATADGFSVAADTGPNISADMLAALGADLLERAARSAQEFDRGQIHELYLGCENGFLVVARCGQDRALICLASSTATLGLLLIDVRRAAGKLQ